MSAERVIYLDSSAIVKLVVQEPESAALRTYLRRRRPLVSSAVARVEVVRALLPLGETAVRRGYEVLARIELIRISDRILTAATTIEPTETGPLDAIHLGTMKEIEDDLVRFITYDDRIAVGARRNGWPTLAPA